MNYSRLETEDFSTQSLAAISGIIVAAAEVNHQQQIKTTCTFNRHHLTKQNHLHFRTLMNVSSTNQTSR